MSSNSITFTTIHDKLSSYNLFNNINNHEGKLEPSSKSNSFLYEMQTPLFSDYALKSRIIHFLDENMTATHQNNVHFDLPVGTIVSKTFAFPQDFDTPTQNVELIETRLLIHQPDGWVGIAYIWNENQDEAYKSIGGTIKEISFLRNQSEQTSRYLIPSQTQCLQCHHLYEDPLSNNRKMVPIGIKARHLNQIYEGENQILRMLEAQKLVGVPEDYNFVHPENPPPSLEQKARLYLDINCAHCHNPLGSAGIISGLLLQYNQEYNFSYGFCKRPNSAGTGSRVDLIYDLISGDAQRSILFYRINISSSGLMPPIARSLVDQEGVQLIENWINSLSPKDCD